MVSGRQVFPTSNIWNTRVDSLPVDKNSNTYVNSLGASTHIHPDWGSDPTYGIPFNVVNDTPSTNFPDFSNGAPDESDPGPYPIVNTSKLIEGSDWNANNNDGDRHVLLVDTTNDVLYELYSTTLVGGVTTAYSGAIFPLNSNALRPDTWTSADAAGLPVFPALINYPETAAGPIKNAMRFTGHRSNGYIWPARHLAGTQTAGYPPFGQRFRLKKSFSISGYSQKNQRILTALKEYGMFFADLGSDWYITGAPHASWDDDDLNKLKNLQGSDFEAVDESAYQGSADSAQAILKRPVLRPAKLPISSVKWPK